MAVSGAIEGGKGIGRELGAEAVGVVTWGKTWVLAQMKTTGRASVGKGRKEKRGRNHRVAGFRNGGVILKSCFLKDTVYKL